MAQRFRCAADRDEDDPLEAGIAFHHAVLVASNNRFMRQFRGLTEATLRSASAASRDVIKRLSKA